MLPGQSKKMRKNKCGSHRIINFLFSFDWTDKYLVFCIFICVRSSQKEKKLRDSVATAFCARSAFFPSTGPLIPCPFIWASEEKENKSCGQGL